MASLDGHLDTEAPPLPPRDTEATRPDSCRHSTGSLDPPELPARPNLPKRNEIYSLRSDRSEKSEANTADDLTGKKLTDLFSSSYLQDCIHQVF